MAKLGNLRKHPTRKARDPSDPFLLAPKKFFNEIFNVFNLNQLLQPHDLEALGTFFGTNLPTANKKCGKDFHPRQYSPPKPMEPVSFCIIHLFFGRIMGAKNGADTPA